MPAPRPDLELRVERNADDIVAIYEMLAQQSHKVDAIEDKVTTIDNKVTTIDETLAEHGRHLIEILKRLPPVA